MKVNTNNKNNTSFNGIYDSKGLKKILRFAENNGALFTSAVTLTLSATARPAAIMLTPHTDEDNKKFACTKSMVSALFDAAITLLISLPLVHSVGKIQKNPQKYLNPSTIKKLRQEKNTLSESRAFAMAGQIFKLGTLIAIAAPKAIGTVLLIPTLHKKIFPEPQNIDINNKIENNSEENNKNAPSFKKKETDYLTKLIANVFNNKKMQDFVIKNQNSKISMHINAIKDALTTTVFSLTVLGNKNIRDDRQGPLIYNNVLATALSIASAYTIDAMTDGFKDKFIKKFAEVNKNDPYLKKYIDGINIAKPILIMAIIYYSFIPFLSTYLAERIDKKAPIKKHHSPAS